MTAEWTEHPLYELCYEITVGYVGSMTREYRDEGVPFFRSKNIREYRIDWDDMKYVSHSFHRKLKKSMLRAGDVAVVRTGKPGTACVIPDYLYEANCSDLVIMRVNPSLLSPHFLSYYLNSVANHQISSQLVGAVQQHFNVGAAKKLSIVIPTLKEQESIVKVAKDLDDKIQLNHQINQTLEQIAQAIFKSWFVDFDPVKAKIAAKERWLAMQPTAESASPTCYAGEAETLPDLETYMNLTAMQTISGKDEEALASLQQEQPEQYAELWETTELFPSAMQDSELGKIPEGWAARELKSVTTEIRRGISPKYIEDGGIQVINQKCIRNHKIDFDLARRNDSSKRKTDGREIQIGDVLVNSTGVGTLGRLAPVRLLLEPSVADSHVTVVRANYRLISKAYLAGLMLVSEPFIEASGAGSTGQTELRKQVLEDIMFAMPPLELSRAYEKVVSPMGKQMACLQGQLTSLATTRDTILPKLLSGELSVLVAEDQAAEAAEPANV